MDQKINLHFYDTLTLFSTLAKAMDDLSHSYSQMVVSDKNRLTLPSTNRDGSALRLTRQSGSDKFTL
jgi:hypothetical protein